MDLRSYFKSKMPSTTPVSYFLTFYEEITRFDANSPKYEFLVPDPTILENYQFSHFIGFLELFRIQIALNNSGIIFRGRFMGKYPVLAQIAQIGIFWPQNTTILENFQFSHFNEFVEFFQIENVLNNPGIIFR